MPRVVMIRMVVKRLLITRGVGVLWVPNDMWDIGKRGLDLAAVSSIMMVWVTQNHDGRLALLI
jgi:hypothetical protein